MRNKKSGLLFCAGLLTTVVSCSDSVKTDGPEMPDDNAIRFAAATEYTRGGDITTNNLNSFNVYAYTGGATSTQSLFMDNVTVTKTGSNTWTYSPLKYWPVDETVDFYAYAPGKWVGDAGPLVPVPYDASSASQDIIYSVITGLSGSKGTPDAQVVFNFKHALSKVTVKMRSSDEDLVVKVSNVAMANIMSKGNFHFPSSTTAGEATADNTGTWSDQNTAVPVLLHMSQDAGDLITLTTTATDMSSTGLGLGGAKYLIPQLLSYRSNGSGRDTYLSVMCSIYDAKTGAKLWPNANTPSENIVEGSTFGDGLLKFPLSTSSFSEWNPGYHYVYNLVINANEEMGAIEFGNPTVETYVDVTTDYK